MALDRIGVTDVAIGLPRLGEQYQRGRVRSLRAEGQIEQDERVRVEGAKQELRGVQDDPYRDQHRLPHDELRRSEEASEPLGRAPEAVAAEGPAHVLRQP